MYGWTEAPTDSFGTRPLVSQPSVPPRIGRLRMLAFLHQGMYRGGRKQPVPRAAVQGRGLGALPSSGLGLPTARASGLSRIALQSTCQNRF